MGMCVWGVHARARVCVCVCVCVCVHVGMGWYVICVSYHSTSAHVIPQLTIRKVPLDSNYIQYSSKLCTYHNYWDSKSCIGSIRFIV